MSRVCRIYLKINEELRSFYWFSLGSDGSIYFSSSNSKGYRRGFFSSKLAPADGCHFDTMNEGRSLTREEMENYHSMHRSGVFALPIISEGKRIRRYLAEIDKYDESIPLVAILPMNPLKYPIVNRTPNFYHDIVIDITELINKPFAISFYAKTNNDKHPISLERKDEWDIYKRGGLNFDKYELWYVLYSNTTTFKNWQELENELTPHPNESGKLAWIVVTATH